MLDLNHPSLKPLWIRVVTVVACLAMGAWEAFNGNSMWSMLFFGIGAYSFYGFFIVFNPRDEEDETPSKDGAQRKAEQREGPSKDSGS